MGLSLLPLAGLSLWQYLELEAERERRRPIYREEDWVLIQPGEFQMGSLEADEEASDAEKPQLLTGT